MYSGSAEPILRHANFANSEDRKKARKLFTEMNSFPFCCVPNIRKCDSGMNCVQCTAFYAIQIIKQKKQ